MRGSARIEARPDISDDGSMNSGTEAEGNLIPFYRWARIQDPDRPSVYQQLLSVFRKAPHVEQVASKAKQSTSGRVSATTQLAGEKLE